MMSDFQVWLWVFGSFVGTCLLSYLAAWIRYKVMLHRRRAAGERSMLAIDRQVHR